MRKVIATPGDKIGNFLAVGGCKYALRKGALSGQFNEIRGPSEYAGKAMVKTLASRIANMIRNCLTWIISAHHGLK